MKKLLTIENYFCLTIFCIPLYLLRFNLFGLPINAFEMLCFFAIIGILVKNKKVFTIKIFGIPKFFLLACELIFFGLILSAIFNGNYPAGLGILKSWFLIPLLFSFTLYSILNSTKFLENIYKSLFYSSGLIGIISLSYKIIGFVTFDNRLRSFYLSPNYLAMYLAPGLFFGLYFLQKSFLKNELSKNFFLNFLLLLFILFPLYFTYSYGAWIAIFGSFFIITLLTSKNKTYFYGAILFSVICLASLFFSQAGTQKFSDFASLSSRSSLSSRAMIWNSSLLMIEKNPIFGIGPGNFQVAYLEYQKYFPPYLEWAVPQPHNLFLAFWLQTGMIGFAGFLILLFYLFKILCKLLRNEKSAALAAPLFGFFLYTCLHGLIDTPFWKNDLAFLFWLCTLLTIFLKKSFLKN